MIRVAMTSELSKQRNDAITYFTWSNISRHWQLFLQNRSRELFSLQYGRLDVLEVKAKSLRELWRSFGMKFLSLDIR